MKKTPLFILIFLFFNNLNFATTCTWLGGNGDWNNPANWSCGTVPMSADSAIVAGCAQTITLTADLSVGYLKILCGGNAIVGPHTLDVSGLTEFAEFQYTLGGCTINMNGGGTIKGTLILNNATLRNATGQTLTNLDGNGNGITGATGIFLNDGTYAITQSLSTLSCQFTNNGTVSIAAGSTFAPSGGNFTINGGDYQVNGTIGFSGNTNNFNIGNATFSGTGNIACSALTTTFGSGCNFANTLDFNISATTVGSGFPVPTTTTFHDALNAGDMSVSGANVIFINSDPSTLGNLTINYFSANGTSLPSFQSNGNFTVQNLAFNVGTISGSFTLSANGLVIMPPQSLSTKTINGATLEMYGNCTWNLGNIDLQNGALLRNMPGSVFTENLLNTGFSINGIGHFENLGIFEVTSLNNPTISSNFTNIGTLRGVNNLNINGAFTNTGTWSPGINSIETFTINPDLNVGNGKIQIELGSSGNDLLHSNGNILLNGILEVTLANGFTPSNGQTFTILTAGGTISGTFNAAILPINTNQWSIIYNINSVILAYDACNNPPAVTEITLQDNFPTSGNPNDDATCHSGDLAFGANIIFNTGTPPFSYFWSASPASNAVFTDNTASFTGAVFNNTANDPIDVEITVVVTDANGCTGSETISVAISPQYSMDIIRTEKSGTINDGGVCFGDMVTFEASLQQTGSFSYEWKEQLPPNPPQTLPYSTAIITLAPPYNNQNTIYYAIITDGHGCTIADFSSAKGIEEIIANSYFKPACTPGDPDSIRVEVTGGGTSSGNYIYEISTLPLPEFHGPIWTFPVFVPPGSLITIMAKDEKGCSDEADIILPSPPAFLEAVALATFTDCSNNGTVDLTVSGGTPPYSFLWSNNETSEDLYDLPAGIYTGTITDVNGCTVLANAEVVLEPDLIWYADADGDGFGNPSLSQLQCEVPFAYVGNNDDCNDNNMLIYPGTDEICNNTDDNCNGQIDEGLELIAYYPDNDNDGFGDNNSLPNYSCNPVPGAVWNNLDCDDSTGGINPAATETCNGLDDNCDGQVDEGVSAQIWYADNDGDGFGDPFVSQIDCSQPVGYVPNDGDCDDSTGGINPAATEVCNGVDDNCDGQIDEGVILLEYWSDNDGDGYGGYSLGIFCVPPANATPQAGDCNDWNPNIHPNAMETCNWQDDNCNGQIDEGVQNIYYVDGDGDGFGNPSISTVSCFSPPGFVENNLDCNDNIPNIYPNAPEICDGFDNNCNGLVDDGLTFLPYWSDNDHDGYGEYPLGSYCTPPPNTATQPGDCNDWNAAVHPGAMEICNWLDDDCDGQFDEGVGSVFYLDSDGDGYGNSNIFIITCFAPWGYVAVGGDCNDNNSTIHPGAAELCDGFDNNCNGQADEGLTFLSYWSDNDHDAYGQYYLGTFCTAPANSATQPGDCHDWNANIHPGATEICNWQDDDCDGQIDEGAGTTWYADADGDGYGNQNVALIQCFQPWGYVNNKLDCNDANAAIKPGAVEICNNIDDNCDGQIDNITGPDLIVNAVNAPSTVIAGQTINVSGFIKNQGTATAGTNRVRWYLSNDPVISGSDYSPNSWFANTNNIGAGATKSFSKSIVIPSNGWNGTKYLIFKADQLNQVSEACENNNELVHIITISPAMNNGTGERATNFSAVLQNRAVSLDWLAIFEQDVVSMSIERSQNGIEFMPYIKMTGTNLKANQADHFQKIDDSPLPGDNYYQIKFELMDGTFAYSSIQYVNLAEISNFEIMPNPADRQVQIYLEKFMGKEIDLLVTNAFGQVVYQQHFITVEESIFPIDLQKENFKDGLYLVSVIHKGRAQTRKLVVSKF